MEILNFAEVVRYLAEILVCCDLFKVCLRETLFVRIVYGVGALEDCLPVFFNKFLVDDWSIESSRFSLDG